MVSPRLAIDTLAAFVRYRMADKLLPKLEWKNDDDGDNHDRVRPMSGMHHGEAHLDGADDNECDGNRL